MKDIELRILKRYNELQEPQLEAIKEQYSRFDAINYKEIAEIKFRKTHYKITLIEFDKYAYNVMYGQIWNRDFIYIVGDPTGIYVFNITLLNFENYDYLWEARTMPRTSEFKDAKPMTKLVGYIDWQRCSQRLYGGKKEKELYI